MLRKLLMIVFGIALVLAAGSCNIYPLYLNNMMEKFGYTLKEANLYGSFINLGLWASFTMGIIYDKFGPKVSCIIGAVLLSGSFAVLHLIMNSELISLNIFPLLLIALVMGQGSALCYTTAVTTNLKNFHSNNSAIVGLLVSNMAISPSIFTTYRNALSDVKIAQYFLMISVIIALVVLVCGWVFTNIKDIYSDHEKLKGYEQYKEKKVIRLLLVLNILILAIYTFGVIFNNLNSDNRFPNAIIYPCLQSLNFIFVIFEKFGLWEKVYFREFIEKEIRRKLNLDDEKDQREINKIIDHIVTPLPLVEEKSNHGIINHNENLNVNNINININNVIQVTHNDGVNIKIISEGKFEDINLEKSYIKKNNLKRTNSFDSKKEIEYSKVLNSNFENEKINEKNYNIHNTTYGGDEINLRNKIKKMFKLESNNISKQVIVNEIIKESIIHKNEIKLEKREGNIEEIEIEYKIENNNIQNNIENQIENNVNNSQIIISINQSEFLKFLQIISQKEILILFTILILGIGSAIANLNNIQFIISSITKAPTSKEIYDYAVLYFVFNSFFRILSGLILDMLIEKNKTFHFIICISIIGLISQILGTTMDKELLFISVALAGATHGGYMTFTPIYTRQFGLENMGKILGFLTTGCAIGSLLIADFIFTFFYDHYKIDEKCFGTKCFSNAYIITSIFFLINIILSFILLKLNNKNKKHIK